MPVVSSQAYADGNASVTFSLPSVPAIWYGAGIADVEFASIGPSSVIQADGVGTATFGGEGPSRQAFAYLTGVDRHIRRGGDDYAQMLLSLLPQGVAWSRDVGTVMVRGLWGLAQYWGFVDGRAADLLERESDPRQTVELLPDWERAWGLPDRASPTRPRSVSGARCCCSR
jgi:hypothetical protein